LIRANAILALADRWHKLPGEIEEMDAGVMRMLEIARRGRREVTPDA
jgi:hypothetical protein